MNPDTQGMTNKINVNVSLVLRTFLATALDPDGYNHAQTKVCVSVHGLILLQNILHTPSLNTTVRRQTSCHGPFVMNRTTPHTPPLITTPK